MLCIQCDIIILLNIINYYYCNYFSLLPQDIIVILIKFNNIHDKIWYLAWQKVEKKGRDVERNHRYRVGREKKK